MPVSKCRWNAKSTHEYVENYKILQQAFKKNDIKRYIDVNKLVLARPLDNIEFCQWIKKYFELNYGGKPYDAVGRRKGAEIYLIAGGSKVNKMGENTQKPQAQTKLPSKAPVATGPTTLARQPLKPTTNTAQNSATTAASSDPKVLKIQLAEAKKTMQTFEKERDFYFGKLRDIEMMLQLQGKEDHPLGA